MKWEKLQRAIFIVFLILVIGSLLAYHIFQEDLGIEIVRQYLKGFGVWTPLVFIALYVFGTIFIPSTPFMAAAGILFGFKYGLIYSLIGGFVSSLLVFAISRKLGKEKMENILRHRYLKHLNQYNKRLGSGATIDLIVLRILPVMPFNVLNILMGVSKIKTGEYILGSIIGLIPSNILTVYFGNVVSKIF